jgi:hypothetical protein
MPFLTDTYENETLFTEVSHVDNSLAPRRPYRTQLPVLEPGESAEFPIVLHAGQLAEQHLRLLFVFREVFGFTRSHRIH